jgi:hypothetical protein
MQKFVIPNSPEGERVVELIFKIVQQHRARKVEQQQEAKESPDHT